MKAFSIDNDKAIVAFDSRADAIRYIESGEGGAVFSTKEQLASVLAEVPISGVVEIYNTFPGVSPIKTFKNGKAKLIERVFAECQKLGDDLAEVEAIAEVAEATNVEANSEIAEAEATTTANVGAQPAQEATKAPKASKKAAKQPKAPKAAKPAKEPKSAKVAKTPKAPKVEGESKGPRDGSKTARLIAMLSTKDGVTLETIMSEFGWLAHTSRALLSAGGALTKNHGITVLSEKVGDKRRYRIAA